MDKLKELKRAQSELGAALNEIESAISDIEQERDEVTVDPWDYESEYREYLDEEGPMFVDKVSFCPSEILQELDPSAFNQGLHDFTNQLIAMDTPEYQQFTEEIEECEEEHEQATRELEEILQLMEEIEELMGSIL